MIKNSPVLYITTLFESFLHLHYKAVQGHLVSREQVPHDVINECPLLTSLIETDFVEISAARLMTDILVNQFRTQLVQADCVAERFTAKQNNKMKRRRGTKNRKPIVR